MSSTFRQTHIPDPPSDPKELARWARDLVQAVRRTQHEVERALNDAEPVARLQVLHAAPDRSQDGDEVEADGTNWNPGSGAGKYVMRSGSWVFVG